MKKILLIIVAAIALASCNSHDKVISKKKMACILRDIHITDAVLNTHRYSQNGFQNIDSLYLYKAVFEKNNVSRDEFIHSLQYYSKYPRKLDEIYTMVVNDLSSKQAKMREDTEKQAKKGMKNTRPVRPE